jgi:tetratricopeptide (TPR) repeat protein
MDGEITNIQKEKAMKKMLLLNLILAAALTLAACGSSQSKSMELSGYNGGDAPAAAPMAESYDMALEEAPAAPKNVQSASDAGSSSASVERMVIQNADLVIVVADVKGRMDAIQKMAQAMGGFVVSSNLYQSYTSDYVEVPEAQITIRVPAEQLDKALEQIKKDVVEVQNENRSGQDVTAEYVDLQSRLKNYEAAEAQLEEIMNDANRTEDVVNVFNQLVYYREQIELVKGQMKYYEEAAALSAINIRIVAEETIQPVVIGKWEPKGVALEAVQDLVDFLKGFVDFLIRFVIYTLPVLILIFIPITLVFLGARAVFRKWRGKKKVQPQETPVEKK